MEGEDDGLDGEGNGRHGGCKLDLRVVNSEQMMYEIIAGAGRSRVARRRSTWQRYMKRYE